MHGDELVMYVLAALRFTKGCTSGMSTRALTSTLRLGAAIGAG
jgi:hypothetical protein